MSLAGDHVSISNGTFPWRQRGWLRDRLREMLYSLTSWPYAISLSLTVFFFLRPDAITLQAMLMGWGLAFARREFASWMAQRSAGAAISRSETRVEGKG